jgi:hypothetical protein
MVVEGADKSAQASEYKQVLELHRYKSYTVEQADMHIGSYLVRPTE